MNESIGKINKVKENSLDKNINNNVTPKEKQEIINNPRQL